MSEKRKDKRGRILRTGEDQLPDGRYRYRYNDAYGNQKAVYSWRLILSDKFPEGKRRTECLRDMEERIDADLHAQIDPSASSTITLNEMYRRYMDTKTELRRSSQLHYEYLYRSLISNGLGKRKLRDVHYSDIKKLYGWMRNEKGYQPRTVETMNNILHPIFEMAVRDEILRRNPTVGVLSEMRQSPSWVIERRHALTQEEQTAFMKYVSESPIYHKWLPLFTFLLGTGCRIGEALGLRWANVDFKAGLIHIDHTLSYLPNENGRREFHCMPTKTAASVRNIPIMESVREALLTEQRRQSVDNFPKKEVDGWDDFVFLNSMGNLHSAVTVNQTIKRICLAYNKREEYRAEVENREPKYLPNFSAHSLRHSFCSRLCENESNIKIIQEIMGHSSIETTMDIYAEVSDERKQAAVYSLEGKVKIV